MLPRSIYTPEKGWKEAFDENDKDDKNNKEGDNCPIFQIMITPHPRKSDKNLVIELNIGN